MSHIGSVPVPRRVSAWILAVAGVAVALVTTGMLVSTHQGTVIRALGKTGPHGTNAAAQLSTLRAGNLPDTLRIASVGINAEIGSLGLNRDGTVQVPADPSHVGWYRLGPRPGQPGSAVLLGHVDSLTGPAVFYRLGTVPIGARIQVGLADGRTLRFTVQNVATYLNWNFPASTVYRNRGRATLTLVTCGGIYDKARGGYQANVVVTAGLEH